MRRRCEEGEDLRYRHFHHHLEDRVYTATGLPSVKSGETNFPDDQRRGVMTSPKPKRPRNGGKGVEESPSKKATPGEAAAINHAAKKLRDEGELPLYDAQKHVGTAMPQPSPKEMRRRDAGFHNPTWKNGIDPSEFKAGTFLCTLEQINKLIQMCDAHNRDCSGTLSFRPKDCTFVGVVAHLRPQCSTCGRKSWHSSPLCDLPQEGAAGGKAPKSFFLNEIVCQAIGTNPVN
eukprot:COSAG06_NODE_16220_length_1013_cov_0.863239_1_plen_231_part_10